MDVKIELDQGTFEKVTALVHKYTGITMSDHKKSLIQSRLLKRMKILSLSSYKDYLEHLTTNRTEVQFFINSVTTNETFFFRTARIWEYFQNDFLPNWYKKNPGGMLKVWSAASSSGEEAYTIAICCSEFSLKNPGFKFKIVGSDVSTNVLEEATHGEYFGRSIEAFKTSHKMLFEKYLTNTNANTFLVKDIIKKHVEFHQHNLFDTPKMKNYYDLVFLRNVLIYFEAKDQEKVLKNIHQSLVKEGILIIGESESLTRLDIPFDYLATCIYQTGNKNE